MTQPHRHGTEPATPFWRSEGGIGLIMLVVIGLFYVAREHYGHLSLALPYLILLLCPLMHLFGHNHGGHSHQDREAPSKPDNAGTNPCPPFRASTTMTPHTSMSNRMEVSAIRCAAWQCRRTVTFASSTRGKPIASAARSA